MRKVYLRMNEQLKYYTIKDFVDHGGNKHRVSNGTVEDGINKLSEFSFKKQEKKNLFL